MREARVTAPQLARMKREGRKIVMLTAYDFPFEDPFVATVVGTPEEYRAELPAEIPLRKRGIRIFEDREVPDFVWHDEKLRYS